MLRKNSKGSKKLWHTLKRHHANWKLFESIQRQMIQMLLTEWKPFLIHVQPNSSYFSNLLLVFVHPQSLIFQPLLSLKCFIAMYFFVFLFWCVKLVYCSMTWPQTLLPQCNLCAFMGPWMYSQSWDLIIKAFSSSDFMTVTYLNLKARYLICISILKLYLPFWMSNFHPVVFVPI